MTQTQELLAKTTPHEQRQRRTLQGSTDFDFIGVGPLLLKFFLGQVTPAKGVFNTSGVSEGRYCGRKATVLAP